MNALLDSAARRADAYLASLAERAVAPSAAATAALSVLDEPLPERLRTLASPPPVAVDTQKTPKMNTELESQMQIHDNPALKAEARNLNFFYGEAKALKGIKFGFDTYAHKTKEGKTISLVRYSHIEQTDEEITKAANG